MSGTCLTFGDIGGKLHMLQIECAGIARRSQSAVRPTSPAQAAS